MTSTLATAGLSSGISQVTAKSGADASLATKDANGSQDRFLKLLVAQLSNQDPMNPMDNAQMTSQIAQINTVTGIQQLNETMKAMATQMGSLQMLQAGGLVGHGVLVEGNQLVVDDKTHSAVGAIELASAASSVKIQVTSADGKVVDTVSLGAKGAGQHAFTLDGKNWPDDAGPLHFTVLASNGAEPVASTALMRDTVTSVGNGTGGLTLGLLGTGSTPYGSVRAVL